MRRYFEEEMRYLRDEGKVFSARHPEQAKYLNIDSIGDRDPFVERLFEGFAFLTGRIHERLDDELPEYSEGFFSLLYPHFLKPIPALSIAEFRPAVNQLSESIELERGIEITSPPVGPENTACRFTTTEKVRLRPMTLLSTDLVLESNTTHSLVLNFRVADGARIRSRDLSAVRLYFNAEPHVASTLHLYLTRNVQNVHLSASGGDTSRSVTIDGPSGIRAGGFGAEEGLLPYSARTSSGSRLIQEYFNFRQKFHCVDLLGLDQLGDIEGGEEVRVAVKFSHAYPADSGFTKDNFLLHCCPVINLFETDADPVRILPTEAEYRIVADGSHRNSVDVYDFMEVIGIEEKSGVRRRYTPYYEFERDNSGAGRYYVQSFRVGPDDHRTAYISLSTETDSLEISEPEVLSMTIRATNGNTSREFLREGLLNTPGAGIPSFVKVMNLSQPSLFLNPPLSRGKDYYWKLLSHLSLNRTSIGSASALREMLDLYNWSQSDGNARRIQSIKTVSWTGKDIIVRGGVLRGAEISIDLAEDHFSDQGDLCLFGLVLAEFLSMYATINSFIHLKIIAKPSEKTYEWKPKRGLKALL